ncbi:hypothetical protein [Mesorhizobium sp. M0408]|uniref:non-homologous end-joining DNA ligase LigD n=1 Tax=unclassified Mesorhizobium TaxID=325217 RepID=UPI003336CB88
MAETGYGCRKADRLVFDLDPDEGLDFEAVRAAAFQFRAILESLGRGRADQSLPNL